MNDLLRELQQRRRGGGAGSRSWNKRQVNRLIGAAVSFVKNEVPYVDLDSMRRTIPDVDRLVSDAEAENAALRRVSKQQQQQQQHRDDSDAATIASYNSILTLEPFVTKTIITTRTPAGGQDDDNNNNNNNNKSGNERNFFQALVASGTVAAAAVANFANEVRRDSAAGLPVQNLGQLMDLLRDVGIEPLHILAALSVVAGFFQRELGLNVPGLSKPGSNNNINTAITSDMKRISTKMASPPASKPLTSPAVEKKQQQPQEASTGKTKRFPLFGKRRNKEKQVKE